MRYILCFKKVSSFSLLSLLIGGALVAPDIVQAEKETTTAAQKNMLVPKPPKLTALSDQDMDALIDKANKGDEAAQNEVVKRYHWGRFSENAPFKKVDVRSWKNVEERAIKDYHLAYFLIMRDKISKFPNLLKSIKEKADQGDASFQNILGVLLLHPGHPENKRVILELYKKSAAQGFAPAQHNLAGLYELGMEVSKDDQKAFDFQKKAAEQGYAAAEFRVGEMYFNGQGVPENILKGIEWIEKSAAQGLFEGQEFMKFLKSAGWDGAKNIKNSLGFLQAAADKGNTYAQRLLGNKYHKGIGVKKDDKKALLLWQKAADQGDTQSLMALGAYFLFEQDNDEDVKKAFPYFQKASDLGDEDAQACLGLMYFRGIGTEPDEKKGLDMLLAASEKGSIIADWFLEPLQKSKEPWSARPLLPPQP